MMYYVCPHCGANLDPGENCDCHKEETALGEATTQDGNTEQIDKAVSTTILTVTKEVVNHE